MNDENDKAQDRKTASEAMHREIKEKAARIRAQHQAEQDKKNEAAHANTMYDKSQPLDTSIMKKSRTARNLVNRGYRDTEKFVFGKGKEMRDLAMASTMDERLAGLIAGVGVLVAEMDDMLADHRPHCDHCGKQNWTYHEFVGALFEEYYANRKMEIMNMRSEPMFRGGNVQSNSGLTELLQQLGLNPADVHVVDARGAGPDDHGEDPMEQPFANRPKTH